MVRLQTLDLRIGVRVPASQPIGSALRRKWGHSPIPKQHSAHYHDS
jgi:hypothetical protein